MRQSRRRRPASPILVRRRSADIWYRGEMIASPSAEARSVDDEADLLAHGTGSEWVASKDGSAFVRWYQGGWRENRLHGVGTILSEASGHIVFRGRFDHGKRTGFGREFSPDRQRKVLYRGEFDGDKKNGVGAFYWEDAEGGPSDGRMQYEGELLNGRFHGQGTLYYRPTELRAKRRVQYRGPFKNGLRHGPKGAEFTGAGELLYIGGWRLGFRHGDGNAFHQNWHGRLCFAGRFEIGSRARLLHNKKNKKERSMQPPGNAAASTTTAATTNNDSNINNGNTTDRDIVRTSAAVPHGGYGQLFLRDGRRFVGHFCQGATDPLFQGTMYYPPEVSVCHRITGNFDKTDARWVSGEATAAPKDQIWRGVGRTLFRDASLYEGHFRDSGNESQPGGRPHGKSGLMTLRNLNQRCGRWRRGTCTPATFSRLVVRRGFAIVLSSYKFPSHVPDPRTSEGEAEKIEDMLLGLNFTVWREDNARRAAIQNLLVEAAAHLNAAYRQGTPHDCLFVFTSGLCRRPGTVCCAGDMKEMPLWEDYLSDDLVPALRDFPKFYVSQCSHAPRETRGWSMQPRLEECYSRNVYKLYSTRTGESIWDASAGSARFIDKFIETLESASVETAAQKSFPGVRVIETIVRPVEAYMDGLAPFEFLKSQVPPREEIQPRVQFLSKDQLQQRDREYLRRVIRARAEDVVGLALAEAMVARRRTVSRINGR